MVSANAHSRQTSRSNSVRLRGLMPPREGRRRAPRAARARSPRTLDAQSTSTRSESLSKYEFDQSEGRLFVVGKKSNIMIANFYISQIIAIYTNASAEVGVHRGWIFAPSGWAVETHLPNAPTACPELTCLSSASPT